MASDIWFTSDTHFGHANFLRFKDEAGNFIRPFSSVSEMDELMIQRWNSVVKRGDKVYHLGDVSFDREKFHATMIRLNGSKRLCLGNHDRLKEFKMWEYFQKIDLWRIFKEYNFICTHVPLDKDQMRKVEFNVHGHIHQRKSPSAQHINICVEQTDYTPLHLDQIVAMIKRK